MKNPRYYHGAPERFNRPDPRYFKPYGPYGSAYYLTTDRAVAVMYGNEALANMPAWRRAQLKASLYIREVDVPDTLRLFSMAKRVLVREIRMLISILSITDVEKSNTSLLDTGNSGQGVYIGLEQILRARRETEPRNLINDALRRIGYDGIDDSSIIAIFPSAMGKLRNLETGEPEANPLRNPTLYHGTTGGPDRPESPRAGGGLLGNGYYLASTEEAAAAWTKRRVSYGEREPVVRVIDMPDDMKLFDLNAKLTPETVKKLAATKQGRMLREDIDEEILRRDDAPTNGTLYRVFGKDWSNSVLAEAGYDGVIQHHKEGYVVPAAHRGWQWITIGAWDEVMIFPSAMSRLKTASWKRVFNPRWRR